MIEDVVNNEQMDLVNDILQKKNMRQPQVVKMVETRVEDPQTINANKAVWHINRMGILDHSSCIQIPLRGKNANSRLGMYQGCNVIKRAVLRTSNNQILCEQNDANFLMSIYNQFKEDERVNRQYLIERGIYNTFEFKDREGLLIPAQNNGAGDLPLRFRLTDTDYVEYCITLKQLFPQLYPQSIPVQFLKNYLVLEVEFETDGTKTAVPADGIPTAKEGVEIDTNNCKLLADYIIYDDKTMNMIEKMTQTSNGLVISYCNYITVLNALSGTAPAEAEANITHRKNIGLSGYNVKHMLITHEVQHPTLDVRQKVAGKCGASLDPAITFTDDATNDFSPQSSQSFNLKINNLQYFTEDLQTGEFFRELYDVFNVPVNANLGQYMYDVADPFTQSNFYGSAVNTTLRGTANIIGINFSHSKVNGTAGNTLKIGAQPVEIVYRRQVEKNTVENVNQRVFVAVARNMVVKNGMVMTNF